MAITRCPYCRAIIDEKDQFCTNCGTQLLFPEDEAVEEEIPGDRIVDVADEDKEYEIPPPGIDEDEADDEPAAEDDLEEEVIIIDEIEEAVRRAALGDMEKPAEEAPAAEDSPKKPQEESPKEPRHEEQPSEDPPDLHSREAEPDEESLAGESEPSREPEVSGKAGTSSRPLTFDTRELEKSGRTAADLGNLEIDRWLESRQDQEQEEDRDMINRRKEDDDLPPWAGQMKDSFSSETDTTDMEEPADSDPDESRPIEKPPSTADSGIGLPERVTQAALPFGSGPETDEEISWKAGEEDEDLSDWEMDRIEEDAEEQEEPEAREEPAEDDEAHPPRQASRISDYLKSKAFDLLFMAAFWFVSTLVAARLMETTVFRLVPTAAQALLAYYAVLIVLYFFLFRFFLGETLGDRMFRQRKAE